MFKKKTITDAATWSYQTLNVGDGISVWKKTNTALKIKSPSQESGYCFVAVFVEHTDKDISNANTNE